MMVFVPGAALLCHFSVPCHQLSLWFNDPTERTVENDRRLKSIIVETLFLVFTPGIFAILSSQVTFPHMQLFGDSYIYFSSENEISGFLVFLLLLRVCM